MSEREIARIARVIALGATGQVQKKQRVIGDEGWERTSPFLFLSEDWFHAPGGFEEHPHRGMQTVTFVLEGALEHRDHTGAHGVLRAGDVQWMTAGRGVLHSEMPYAGETAHTLQLWLNLPRTMKMIPARYRDQRLADVPVRTLQAGEVRVYAGRSGPVANAHGSDYPMSLLDIRLGIGAKLAQEIDPAERAFLYVLAGEARIGERALRAGDVAWFEPGDGDQIVAVATTAFRALLFAGVPIEEPIFAYGPFVMSTREEIVQAFEDYQAGRLVT
ncbi:MAG: pirin family protein [Burkholderiales bacterium]